MCIRDRLPDEEVDLSFETSGKIVEINFREGTAVRKGELLAKVNDRPLQAQLSRYEAQRKLAEDRVYRQSALLEKDAVSQEAYEQARTELAMLYADIDIVKSNIALTELHAPLDVYKRQDRRDPALGVERHPFDAHLPVSPLAVAQRMTVIDDIVVVRARDADHGVMSGSRSHGGVLPHDRSDAFERPERRIRHGVGHRRCV